MLKPGSVSLPRLSRTFGAAVAGAMLLTGLAMAPASSTPPDWDLGDDPRNNATGEPVLLTRLLPPMVRGQVGWVGLMWSTETDICEVRVTSSATAGTVGYPTNTGDHSSFYVNDALAEGNLDFTALKLATPAAGGMQLKVEVRYTRLADSLVLRKFDDLVTKSVRGADCRGTTASKSYTLTVPLIDAIGPAVSLDTDQVSVAAGKPTWVDLELDGRKPGLTNVRVALTPPRELAVVYPGDGTSSGLTKGTDLAVLSSDRAGVRLESSVPGTYRVPVRITWGNGGQLTETLTVRVTK